MTEPPQSYFERFHPDYTTGLTQEQIDQRRQQGLCNGESDIKTKSVKEIVLQNIITPFNILNAILASLILLVGSYKNLLFMGVILSNLVIGIFQEIRAKRTIDRLALIAEPKAKVIRNGEQQTIEIHDVVLDDILYLEAGNQICTDCIVCNGECEVNESLLTGESDPICKKTGDSLLSGSFIVSGACHAQVEHVGKDNYAAKISQDAKYLKKPNSEIMTWINRIIKVIGIAIVPIGLILFYKQHFVLQASFTRSIVSTVAALVGMIPEGLVLLTSVVLAVSVIRLASHKTLVQELYCIETLARVDVLCLDKTGTITEGTLQLDDLILLGDTSQESAELALSALASTLPDTNPTMDAVRKNFCCTTNWNCEEMIPFSSANKWSGAFFEKEGCYVLGAPEILLLDKSSEIRQKADSFAESGQRVLLLVKAAGHFQEKGLPRELQPVGLLLFSDKIRPEAPQTLLYFAEQGVDLKVISGDNPITVSNIAKKAGMQNADNYVDATTLQTEEALAEAAEHYSVFGRVTPQQKLQLVKILKQKNHTVAMTGDGVNDVLALKEADCSIAMASGSDAARTVSQLVLLDSNFASLPKVVHEGRRSINNLQRSACLFLVKAFFSAIIAVFFIFAPYDYPLQPIQFSLINLFAIGIPSFILAMEPNKDRIRGKFIVNILTKSLPGMLAMALTIIILMPVSSYFGLSGDEISTVSVILIGFTGLVNLLSICLPFNTLRKVLFYTMSGGFVAAMLLYHEFFSLVRLSPSMLLVTAVMMIFSACVITIIYRTVKRIYRVSSPLTFK
ncbi:MAG: cation-translocating P-type ATPase [Clostridium sp.]|uniref:cation-translocating P-type ATPase n=1 Tax=Clostridium sp. TaxID=1506 RepID=UPI0029062DB4|nr:cation-translocating P-type ATPase [Clostridium sp.]MDU7337112.1 cation-translocating P-type ATPase [Clostridium sp.]